MAQSAASRTEQILRRKASLFQERSSWDARYRDIVKFQQPMLGRFNTTDTNRGNRSTHEMIDNTVMRAARILVAGLSSGATSPARPWFRMKLGDEDLMEYGPVKLWLHQARERVLDVFRAGNTYRMLATVYEELAYFGTAANIVVDDRKNVLHNHPFTVGEYAIATNDRGDVDTLVRDYQMTAGQMERKFGRAALSTATRNLVDSGNLDAWVPVLHLIAPRATTERDIRKLDAINMPWASIYLEPGKETPDKFLGESGFRRFPALAPRWSLTAMDVYGQSPGMEALGHVKQLQHQHLRKSTAIDFMVSPPLQVPVGYSENKSSRMPGGLMYVSETNPGQAIRSAFDVNLNLQHLLADVADIRQQIREAFYADLFLMMTSMDRSGITATEIAERHEEKLLMLGPVTQRLDTELHAPLIDHAFDRLLERQLLPPPPMELQGVELEVEFLGVLAQAQRIVATRGMDRMLGIVGQLASLNPEIIDKVDYDQVVDEYSEAYGVNPRVIRPDDVVAKLREERAQAQAQQQAMASVPEAAKAAKDAGDVNTDGLANVAQMFQGYGTP